MTVFRHWIDDNNYSTIANPQIDYNNPNKILYCDAMIKPKNHLFKVKIMLNKLEAVNNKVASRCHATLKIDNEDLYFKATPELKKNVAVFNSEVEYDNYSLYYDEITGLYENKSVLMVLEIETQGTKVKIGEVQINMGAILNEKKYRIVNQFPLTKCYDKTAKVKLSVDFIPISASIEQTNLINDRKDKKETKQLLTTDNGAMLRQGMSQHLSEKTMQMITPPNNAFKQAGYKSRLAEQSNLILQEKIYEYQQKMDNYRLSQTQLQQRLHEQISSKDQQISSLTIEANRKNQQIYNLGAEVEQLKFRLKEVSDENTSLNQSNRLLEMNVQNLTVQNQNLRKQYLCLQLSLDNQGKAKQNKQKHLSKEIAKYTAKYLQSQQQRNKVVFQLESKFKEEMQKKENNYRLLLSTNDKKNSELTSAFKNKIKQLEKVITEKEEIIDKLQIQNKKITELLNNKTKELQESESKREELKINNGRLTKNENNLTSQLETIQFSYQQLDREVSRLKEDMQNHRKAAEQVKMELQMANQTIEEQRRSLTKFSKELQVYQQREYYLTEKYNDELEIKSINEENIRGESVYFREEIYKLKNQLKISEERAEDESSKNAQLLESLQMLQMQVGNKNNNLMHLNEEKLMLESQIYNLRTKVTEMEQASLVLKGENQQLGEYLRDKKNTQENDQRIEWSFKIEELQRDIAEMVAKFKLEKELMRDSFKKEESKHKDQLLAHQTAQRKNKEEYDILRKTVIKKQAYIKELEKGLDETKAKNKEKSDQLAEVKERVRIIGQEKDELEKSISNIRESGENKLKDLQQKQKKELKALEKSETIKANFVKIVNHLLQYVAKPIQTIVTFNELSLTGTDMEIANIVNLALRKHCQERTRVREHIKKLQIDIELAKAESKKSEKERHGKYKEDKSFEQDKVSPKRLTFGVNDYDWRQLSPAHNVKGRDPYELQNLMQENSKLKRQISQLKVKMKNIEEEVVRAERNTDNQRYTKETAKRQIEDVQDELEKVSFQLRKKEKIVVEYESEMKELQAQIVNLRNAQTFGVNKNGTPSRSQFRMREKEESAVNSRSEIIIKDLESKLIHTSKQNEELLHEINKQKGQMVELREAVANSKNQIKVMEGRIKERTAKIATIQQQFNQKRVALQQEIAQQISKQRKIQQNLTDLQAEKEGDSNRLQLKISLLQKQVQDLQRKIKSTKDESRQTENRHRRQNQTIINSLRQRVNQLETTIIALRSQIEQFTRSQKELLAKNVAINSSLTKKNEELERINLNLTAKQNEIGELQDKFELYRSQTETNTSIKEERIHELQQTIMNKQFELQEYRFKMEGRLMDLQKRLEDCLNAPSNRRR